MLQRILCPSPEACCLCPSADAGGESTLEGLSLPLQGWAVLPKVAFLAIIVASAVALHVWAGTPQMWVPTNVALHSTLLGRKTPRPLRLMVRSVIWSPLLIMSGLGPRWSTNPLRLLRPLTLYLILHLLHYSGLLH